MGKSMGAAAFLMATIWSSPLLPNQIILPSSQQQQLSSSSVYAQAKEMASGSGSRVNKDPESLLRYGLPIQNNEVRHIQTHKSLSVVSDVPLTLLFQVRKLQKSLEDIKLDIGTKRKSSALDNAKKSQTILAKDKDKMVAACRPTSSTICSEYISDMMQNIAPLQNALKDSQEAFQGSEQERAALDKAYTEQEKLVTTLSKLEEQMVPSGYVTPVPPQYQDLPQLHGRATVEMLLKKADNGPFDVQGVNYPEAKMKMIIDGYAAPVTAGNFVELVSKGFYNKMAIQRSDGFVVQTGDPDGEAVGYVAKGSQSVGNGKNGERLIPLEIFVKGDKGPFYESTIEDEGRGGQATVLPFSAYGAMGWAREEYDPNSGSSQFFWLLFDSDLTPAGKNVLDGRYPCFGYVVEGADFLSDIKEGDIIVSAKVTEGMNNLKLP